jgi:hypothetical protein
MDKGWMSPNILHVSSQLALDMGIGGDLRFVGYNRAGAMAHEIRLQKPGISVNKMLINAFPGMEKQERESLMPIVGRCLQFNEAVRTTGALRLPYLFDIAGCTIKSWNEMCAIDHDVDVDSGIRSHLGRALCRAPWWITHVDVKDGNRKVSVKQVLRGNHARREFDGFSLYTALHA